MRSQSSLSDMKSLIDKRLAISDYNFKPVLTTYLSDPDIIPKYPIFIFEQTPHMICFNIFTISDSPTAKRIEVACIKDGPTHLKLQIQLKLNTALLSTVRPSVIGVTSHISHIYKGINAMLIIRGPIKPCIF